jgi:nucleoside phosphorylase/CheY-like chemotaxis protein
MIKILIVDDSDAKRTHIKKVLETIPELSMENVSVATDLVQARDLLSKGFFDLLILDIYLPPLPGERPTPDAGKTFVRELRLSCSLMRPAHVIGLTAYDDALITADSAFLDELWRLIKYDPTTVDWANKLKSKVEYLLLAKKQMRDGNNASFDFDVGIVTTLWDPELKAILKLPLNWNDRSVANDDTKYFVGVPKNRTPNLRIVAASCSQMGIASAAVLTTKMISHFRPRYLAIVGIAAGVKGCGANLGDILIAERSWDYESGKRKEVDGAAVLIPDPHYIPICSELREQFSGCVGRKAYVDDIEKLWVGEKPSTKLTAHFGPIGCGTAVIEDKNVVDAVKEHARKLIGIEMETYGVFYAAENCCKPRPKFLAVKSVSDFADDKKNDLAHDYAAFTSAQYLWRFVTEHITPN